MKTSRFVQVLTVATLGIFVMGGCATENKKGLIGAGAGAVVGGLIGNQVGGKNGAIIGAAAGALAGGAIGHKLDKQAKELEQVAETKRTEQGIITNLKGDILFESGKAELKPAAQENIDKLADIVKKYPEDKLVIVGHTDNTGKKETNMALAGQRAKAVMLQMVARGVPSTAITTVGVGDAQPVGDNKTTEGRQKNRRVELQITMPEQKGTN